MYSTRSYLHHNNEFLFFSFYFYYKIILFALTIAQIDPSISRARAFSWRVPYHPRHTRSMRMRINNTVRARARRDKIFKEAWHTKGMQIMKKDLPGIDACSVQFIVLHHH